MDAPRPVESPREHGLSPPVMRLARFVPLALIAATPACSSCAGGGGTTGAAAHDTSLVATPVVQGLSSSLYLTSPPDDDRLFIVEQRGTVRIVSGGQLLPTPFLDLSGVVSTGGERGLLSLAFHPEFATNGRFFVDYTDASGNTRVVGYRVSASDPNRADLTSGDSVLAVQQPYSNHNGGLVTFGPDGMLYVGLGDGGSGGDPLGNGQDLSTVLGSILRLDVDAGSPYAIPPDNPFVGQAGARGEIWAYGLRNPWRFAFDPDAGLLYIADVGQSLWEEVDVERADEGGLNYGWNTMEGVHCYDAPSCDQTGLTLPVLEYGHDQGCSITGGMVYRGAAMPQLRGTYFYSDYCGGWLRSFRYVGGSVTDARSWDVGDLGQVLSFGRDSQGELYVLSASGTIYRLEPAG